MNLPSCHSRREFDAAGNLFFCAHPRVHVREGLVTAEICKVCRFWMEPPPAKFRTYPLPPAARDPLLCRYLGESRRAGTLRECFGCPGITNRGARFWLNRGLALFTMPMIQFIV